MASRPEHQSIRASCDRCRAKKLGCSISIPETSRTGIQQCERCVRAKVQCIFSRRAQTKRSGDTVRLNEEYASPQRTSEISKIQPNMDTNFFLESSESVSGYNLDWSTWPLNPWPDFLDSEKGLQLDGDPLNPDDKVIKSISELLNQEQLSSPAQQGPQLMNVFGVSPCPSIAGEDCVIAETLKQPAERYNRQALRSSPAITPSNLDQIKGLQTKQDNTNDIVQLSALVAEIHELLSMLKGNPLHLNPNSRGDAAVDAYPVGQVLLLTRKFKSVLTNFWTTKCVNCLQQETSSSSTSCLPLTPLSYNNSTSLGQVKPVISDCLSSIASASSVPVSADVPGMLLLLTCYASLTRLYMMVLTQIQNNLKDLPKDKLHHQTQDFTQQDETIQFGELFSSTSESCSKIYMAVQMFLDEFQSMDDVIGPPNSLNLVSQQFHNNGTGQSKEGQLLESNWKKSSIWFNHQLEMIRTVLDDDARRILGVEYLSFNGLLGQGHFIKATLCDRIKF